MNRPDPEVVLRTILNILGDRYRAELSAQLRTTKNDDDRFFCTLEVVKLQLCK